MNAFDWKGKPSQVVNDRNFKSFNGKTRSQIATEGLQKAYNQGKNVGTMLKDDPETFKKIHGEKK
jgi:hypothetical protein